MDQMFGQLAEALHDHASNMPDSPWSDAEAMEDSNVVLVMLDGESIEITMKRI